MAEAQHWYAFSVRPQQERAASDILSDHGLTPYVPMREKLCIVNRHRKTRERRRLPILSGVVFAGAQAPLAPELLWRVLGHCKTDIASLRRPITALITVGGVSEIPMEQIQRMVKRNGDDEREAMWVRVEKRFHEGEVVRVVGDSPWAGFTAPVEEIRGHRARLMLELFGRETPADVSLDLLEAVG